MTRKVLRHEYPHLWVKAQCGWCCAEGTERYEYTVATMISDNAAMSEVADKTRPN